MKVSKQANTKTSKGAMMGLEPSEELVVLARLDAAHGFFSFGDVLEIAGQLQTKGINAICERAPGGLMDSPDAFYLKVPVIQAEEAQGLLEEILNK